MSEQGLANIFANASRLKKSKKNLHLTQEEWNKMKSMNGARIFKKKVLGIFKSETIKSLDEVAKLLYETGVVPSIEKGKEIVPALDGKYVPYSNYRYDNLAFEGFENKDGQKLCKIFKYDIFNGAGDF
jgi:hypothetical protein